MKKYLLLLLCMFLVTGCGKEKDDELYVEHEYQKNYINAVNHLNDLMTYEYSMVEEKTSGNVVSNVRYNRQGEYAEVTDTATNIIKYYDTQLYRLVEYDTECNLGWIYNTINLTDDSDYGPYIQLLTTIPSEKITKFENDIYYLEVDSKEVSEALKNNLMTYNGAIALEVKLDNDKFKNITIEFKNTNDVKKVTLEFKAYSNVEVMMSQEAQNAIKYIGSQCKKDAN